MEVPPGAPSTVVNCSRCGAEDSVPFTPTPGRPVYCRPCYVRASAAPRRAPPRRTPTRRMIERGRKGHFIYDALGALTGEEDLDLRERRVFVEMVYTRGSRQTTDIAIAFLQEKQTEGFISDAAHTRLAILVERYSAKQ